MVEPVSTKDKLLHAARALFWTRGYSNVSVRDITKAAGVDVALVSRYFGSKQGLFEATLAEIPPWDAFAAREDELLDAAVKSFSHPYDPQTDQANPFTMLLANVIDPEMGERVRSIVQTGLADPLEQRLGGPHSEDRAALLLAVLFGVALMRKNFQIKAMTDKTPAEIEARVSHLAKAALEFKR